MPPAKPKPAKDKPKDAKGKGKPEPKDAKPKGKDAKKPAGKSKGPCPWVCNLVPSNLPGPEAAQTVLHPRKDVFILKVAKVGPNGDRQCKMELELVTPKGPEKKPLCRIETRETQCDPDPPPCYCCRPRKR